MRSPPKNLLVSLYNLKERLNKHGGTIDGSLLDRYFYFLTHSEKEENCAYAKKAASLFLEYDYEAVKAIILETLQEIRNIEGDQTIGS